MVSFVRRTSKSSFTNGFRFCTSWTDTVIGPWCIKASCVFAVLRIFAFINIFTSKIRISFIAFLTMAAVTSTILRVKANSICATSIWAAVLLGFFTWREVPYRPVQDHRYPEVVPRHSWIMKSRKLVVDQKSTDAWIVNMIMARVELYCLYVVLL